MAEESEDAASAFRKLHPRAFYDRFLKRGVRPDGRGTNQVRDTFVSVGGVHTADGSSVVRLGDTTVQCGIRYKVGEPSINAPTDGHIDVRVHLLPICSPKYDSSRPGEETYVIAEFLNRIIEKGKLIDNSELCIKEGKAVYVLFADIVCLNNDGNIMDASLLAILAALRDTKLPTELRVSDSGEVFQVGHSKTRKINVLRFPVPLTFGVFNDVIVADPNEEECEIMDGAITTVVGEHGDVLGIHKHMGLSLSLDQINVCLDLCSGRLHAVKGIVLSSMAS